MPGGYHNSNRKGDFGALQLRRINQLATRSPLHVFNRIHSNSERDWFGLLVNIPQARFAPKRARNHLPGRSMMLINPMRARGSVLNCNFCGFSVRIPGPVIRAKIGNPDDYCLRVLDATHGAGSILVDLVARAWREQDFLSESESNVISAYLVDLLVSLLVVENGDAIVIGGSPMTVAHKRQALRFIDSHLSDPDLGPDSIAAELHISPRYLHQLITRLIGKSVSLIIREKRLEKCRLALVNPQTANRSITQIMMEWGFGNSSHFSRIFKEKFGVSPRAYRNLYRSGASGIAPN